MSCSQHSGSADSGTIFWMDIDFYGGIVPLPMGSVSVTPTRILTIAPMNLNKGLWSTCCMRVIVGYGI